MGFSLAGRCFVGYIYASEFMQINHVSYFASFLLGFDGLTLFGATIFFRFVSVNWKLYQACYLVMLFAGTIPIMFYFPETPKFMHNLGRYAEARQIIAKIAKFNSKDGSAFVREASED